MDYEPVTQCLRGVPLKDWNIKDFDQEIAARAARSADSLREGEPGRWIADVFAPLAAKFPDVPQAGLLHLLPEPERSIAIDLVETRVKVITNKPPPVVVEARGTD